MSLGRVGAEVQELPEVVLRFVVLPQLLVADAGVQYRINVIGMQAARLAMRLQGPLIVARGSVVDRVLNIMVEHYEAQPEATICLAALATEFAGSDHPVLDEIRNAYEAFVAPFEKVLSTHPTVKNPRGASIAFIGSVQGIAIQGLLREGGEYALRDLAKSFLNLIHMPEEAINGNG